MGQVRSILSGKSFTRLVVVGSSAGGIKALSELVSALPEDFPAPLVIAQHLDPESESNLKEILLRRSTLPMRPVHAEEPLEAGVVFVVPANSHVNITNSLARRGGSVVWRDGGRHRRDRTQKGRGGSRPLSRPRVAGPPRGGGKRKGKSRGGPPRG